MKSTFIVILLFISSFCSSQTVSDSIIFIESFNGYKFVYKEQIIDANKVSAIVENNLDAYDAFESGREAKVFGYVFFTIGSCLTVYPFITSIFGKDTNWALTYAGLGFAGLSIPIFHSYHKKTEKAIELYNGSLALPPSELNYQKSLDFRFSESGFGLAYRF